MLIVRFLLKQLRRVAAVFLLVAGAFFFSVPVTWAWMLLKFRRMMSRGVPDGPRGGPPTGGKPDMEEIMEYLKEVPFNPVRPPFLGLAKGALANSYPSVLNALSYPSGRIYPYPRPFEKVVIESFDGTRLAAVVGLHRDGRSRPGLVISHGYMGSKNDHYVVNLALAAFAEWGFNVLGVDLRDFGASQRLGFCPTTFGWKEGEDLLAAARYLGEQPGVTTVGVTGFSMGAVSTMSAASIAGDHPYLTGGAVAWNGAVDALRTIAHLQHEPEKGDGFFLYHNSFRLSHWLRRGDMKRHVTDPAVRRFLDEPFSEYDFESFLARVSAPHYGVVFDELLREASVKNWLADLEVPLLVMHSVDDPVCPVSEMDDLIEIEKRNPNLKVWIMPTGMHCAYPYLDWNWFASVTRGFFEYWADWGQG